MVRARMISNAVVLSRKINAVSEGAENLYYRIYVNTDDFGRFHADPKIIKGQIYTLRNIPIPTIEKRLNELIQVRGGDEKKDCGLIDVYESGGELYLKIIDFEEHQSFRKDYIRKHEFPESGTRLYEIVRSRTKSHSKINKSKEKKIKPKTSCSEKVPEHAFKYSEVHKNLAKLLEAKIKERMPRHKFTGKNYLEEWANEFRIMEEKKEATAEEIEMLIIWVSENDFWYKNIRSADKLRKQFGRLWAEMEDEAKKKGKRIETPEEFTRRQKKALGEK